MSTLETATVVIAILGVLMFATLIIIYIWQRME